MCKDNRLTFRDYDPAILQERVRLYREVTRSYTSLSDFDLFTQYDKDMDRLSDNDKKIRKIIWFLLASIFVMGVDWDPSLINKFWSKKKIDEGFKALEYIAKKLPKLTYRGPFVEMALLASFQIGKNGAVPRGMFLDMLHTINLTYCDVFLTNDDHFIKLKNEIEHPLMERIQSVKVFNSVQGDSNEQ